MAEVHDQHAVGDVPDDVEVVRDEDVGEAEVALEVLEQVEDLRLHRHVERRDRLVADDQLRVDRERAGDADPLPLAAGELVREAVVVLGVEADDLEQLLDAALDLGVGADPCTSSGSPMMKPTRLRGFSEAYGSWKIIIISRRTGRISARESLVMSRPSKTIAAACRLEQLHDAAGERRLAAARLADDAERLARLESEADAVDRLHRGDLLLEDDPARDREVLLDVVDDEELVAGELDRAALDLLRGRAISCLRGHARPSAPSASWSSLLVEVAADAVVAAPRDGGELRLDLPADRHDVRAARVEAAALRRGEQRRRLAGDLHEPLDVLVEARQRAEQAPGVRVVRPLEEVVDLAFLLRSVPRT